MEKTDNLPLWKASKCRGLRATSRTLSSASGRKDKSTSSRPSTSGPITDDIIAPVRARRFIVATLAKGKDNIFLSPDTDAEIVSVTGPGNAASVAELTLILAGSIVRQLPMASFTAGSKLHPPYESVATTMIGKHWGVWGSGHQVQELLPRVAASGCRGVTIYHPGRNVEKFSEATAFLPRGCSSLHQFHML